MLGSGASPSASEASGLSILSLSGEDGAERRVRDR